MSRPAALLFVGMLACGERGTAAIAPAPETPAVPAPEALVDLSASLEPIRAEFEAHRGEHRFITLVAPT